MGESVNINQLILLLVLFYPFIQGDRSSVSSHRSSFRGSSLSLDRESLDSVDVSPRSPTLSRKGSTVSKKPRRSSTADKIFEDEFEKLKRQSRESLRGRSASMGSLLESKFVF